MIRFSRSLIALLAIVALVAAGAARGVTARMDMGSPTAMPAMAMGAAYMTVANGGTAADTLLGGKTDVAETVEVHEMVDVNGVMKMQPLANGLEIPAGGSVELKPGGYHFMLIGLKQDLTAGMTFTMTVSFKTAGEATITVPVVATANDAAKATPVAPVTAGALTISAPWARSAPGAPVATPEPSTATAAAFMTIANSGTAADKLVSVSAEVAPTAEIHQGKKGDNGVMQMSPVEGGLEIPAGGSVVLEPGGYHIMLIGITKDLTAGMTYQMTLTFAQAGDVTITVPVMPAAPEAGGGQPPVTVGAITISNQWTRPAPATGAMSGM